MCEIYLSCQSDEDFVLSDHPTLNHFTAYIQRMKGDSLVVDAQTFSHPVNQFKALLLLSQRRRQSNCKRTTAVVGRSGRSLPESVHFFPMQGTLVVTDDGWGIAEAFCKQVEARGMKAVRVGFESEIRDMSVQQEDERIVYRADPANPEHLALVSKELEKHDIAGLVHIRHH